MKSNTKEVVSYLNTTFNLNIRKLQKGIPYSPWYCPIANTLRKNLENQFVYIVVDREYILIGKQRYDLPDNIRQFVCNFDAAKYPELTEE